jgi:hypothetical protein
MKTEITSSLWKSFFSQNPRFVGFGNLAASTLILSDSFEIDPSSEELEVMFELEKVGATWMEKLTTESSEPRDLEFSPAYTSYSILQLSEAHSLPNTQSSIFYIPLAGHHLYYENRATWSKILRKRLLTYQTLIQSFPTVYYRSNFISRQEIEELLQLNPASSDR